MDDHRGSDRGEVAIPLVGEHDGVRPGPLDARGGGRRTAVCGLADIDLQESVGENRAAHRSEEHAFISQVHLLQQFAHQAVDDAVPTSRAIGGGLVRPE